jgi:hypothetical protein
MCGAVISLLPTRLWLQGTLVSTYVILQFSVINNPNRKMLPKVGLLLLLLLLGYEVAHLVEALRHKPEGRGIDSRCDRRDFSLT